MKISESKGKLRVGDWVRTNGSDCASSTSCFEGEVGEIIGDGFYVFQNEKQGDKGTIQPSSLGYKYSWAIKFENPNEIEIIKSKNNNMSLTEKLALTLTPEPFKTFRKLGITNGDNILTDDGVKVYLSWRLGKDAGEFKKDVCDEMLAEQEKEKK